MNDITRQPPLETLLIARQPILDRNGRLSAYELLYRGERLPGQVGADTAATARVLAESMGSFGLAEISGAAKLFVNFGQELLQDATVFDLLSPQSIVVEVLETVEPTPLLLDAITELRKRGFRIALDDFLYRPSLEPLLGLADTIKIDVLASVDLLEDEVRRLAPRGLQLLAEKVETRAQFDRCLSLGFELFQGYYFCRPQNLSRRPLAANQLVVLELVRALNDPANDIKALAHILNRDVALSYQLLKLANSPLFRGRRAIATMQDAMIVLGLDFVKKWASLLVLSRLASGKPSELLRTALLRAYMCSSLAADQTGGDTGIFFTTGLLSVLDALLDRPMDLVLSELALTDDVTEALLGDERGRVGSVLHQVQTYAAGEWSLSAPSAADDSLHTAYLDALGAADRVLDAIL